jgi:uncharacterized protein YjeT (DUF2065 family)
MTRAVEAAVLQGVDEKAFLALLPQSVRSTLPPPAAGAPPEVLGANAPPEPSDEELLRTFLETGLVPWWAGRLERAELETRFVAMLDRYGAQLPPWLHGHAGAQRMAQRLLGQFSHPTVLRLLDALAREAGAQQALAAVLEATPPGLAPATWRQALAAVLLPTLLAQPAQQAWHAEALMARAVEAAVLQGVDEKAFLELLPQSVRSTLPPPAAGAPPVVPGANAPPEPSDEELLRTFLETGLVPWRAEWLERAELETRFVAMLDRYGAQLPPWLHSHAGAQRMAQRLLGQFSHPTVLRLLQALAREAGAQQALAAVLEATPPGLAPATWRQALAAVLLPTLLAQPAQQAWHVEALMTRAVEAAVLQGVDEKAFLALLPQSVRSALPSPTAGAPPEVPGANAPPEPSDEELLRTFLETGLVPWRAEPLERRELEARFAAILDRHGSHVPPWLHGHAGGRNMALRVLGQFSQATGLRLLEAVAREAGAEQSLAAVLEATPPGLPPSAWRQALLGAMLPEALAQPLQEAWSEEFVIARAVEAAALQGTDRGLFRQRLSGALPKNSLKPPSPLSPRPSFAPSPPSAETTSEQLLAYGLPVDNAGLVILHPFLRTFFQAVGLIEGKGFRDLAAQCRAVCLLQWLAHGDGAEDEHRMALSKLLCGVPLEEVVPRMGGPTETERTEGEELLRHVVAQWKVLKNTSVRGLRESFLQREGLLRQAENGWLLRMETRAYDILLERLPWGLSHIRLSWMKGMLRVER